MINVKMQPTEVQRLSPVIAVAGVGGGGVNAVDNMLASGLEGCDFVVCNADAQSLERSACANKVQLGPNVTGGLGAGSKPEVGEAAAEESLDEVMGYLEGANMVFITAGMGGGTGTGAAHVIARACRERGILTVGVVTKPFHFEGSHRMRSAEAGIEQLQQHVDTLIVIPNQNLFRIANEKTTFAEAFKMADSVLQSGVRGVTDLMVRPGLVNLDFADIRTAMMEMGKAMMGTGESAGEKRAIEAAEAAINNPLLDDVSMKGAHGVIINVTGGYDMTLFEADEACNRIRDEVDPDANIIFGATFDENMEGAMRVSIVATGIEKEAISKTPPVSGSVVKPTVGQSIKPKAFERTAPTIPSTPRVASTPAATPVSTSGLSGQPKSSSVVNASASEPEQEMFEQQEFPMPVQGQSGGGMASNTVMKGTRYKNAFIPPLPIEPEASDRAAASSGSYYNTGFHGQTAQASQGLKAPAPSASGLRLNPPKLPTPDTAKQSPSLLERITGKVQEHLGGDTQESHSSRSPYQTPLSVDKPSKPAKETPDLDIPAFLRRQAN